MSAALPMLVIDGRTGVVLSELDGSSVVQNLGSILEACSIPAEQGVLLLLAPNGNVLEFDTTSYSPFSSYTGFKLFIYRKYKLVPGSPRPVLQGEHTPELNAREKDIFMSPVDFRKRTIQEIAVQLNYQRTGLTAVHSNLMFYRDRLLQQLSSYDEMFHTQATDLDELLLQVDRNIERISSFESASGKKRVSTKTLSALREQSRTLNEQRGKAAGDLKLLSLLCDAIFYDVDILKNPPLETEIERLCESIERLNVQTLDSDAHIAEIDRLLTEALLLRRSMVLAVDQRIVDVTHLQTRVEAVSRRVMSQLEFLNKITRRLQRLHTIIRVEVELQRQQQQQPSQPLRVDWRPAEAAVTQLVAETDTAKLSTSTLLEDELQHENKQLREELDALRTRLQEQQQRDDQQRDEFAVLSTQLEHTNSDNESLRAIIKEQQRIEDELRRQIDQAHSDNEQLRQSHEQLSNRLSELHFRAEISRSPSPEMPPAAELNALVEVLRTENEGLQKKVVSLTGDLQQLRMNNRQLTANLARTRFDTQNALSDLHKTEDELKSLRLKFDSLERDKEQLSHRLGPLESENQILTSRIEQLQAEINRLTSSIELSRVEHQRAIEDLTSKHQHESADRELTIEQLTVRVADAQSELALLSAVRKRQSAVFDDFHFDDTVVVIRLESNWRLITFNPSIYSLHVYSTDALDQRWTGETVRPFFGHVVEIIESYSENGRKKLELIVDPVE